MCNIYVVILQPFFFYRKYKYFWTCKVFTTSTFLIHESISYVPLMADEYFKSPGTTYVYVLKVKKFQGDPPWYYL